MRPIAMPAYIKQLWEADSSRNNEYIASIRQQYAALSKGGAVEPEVSIVIPAYNEEANILRTLSSLCNNITDRAVEIIVVNNNSKDNTETLVNSSSVPCILEAKQGITNARNAGLAKARGKYILNADGDSIYPRHWIEEMVAPMANNPDVAVTYGRFAFIPVGTTGRLTYFFYEYIGDALRYRNKYFKEEAVNAYGFNSGFRREQGLQVDGFNHPPEANEDGWLAVKLRSAGFGKLFYVTDIKALVWTTDRRIQIDGGLYKATIRRIKRVFFGGPR
ncbi:MAG: glycosyltransferase family 2 protein [Flavipsychrobacter sp.]|nr:glycosyltransferase family 2 protein [Flavipsychrobacter sp.]